MESKIEKLNDLYFLITQEYKRISDIDDIVKIQLSHDISNFIIIDRWVDLETKESLLAIYDARIGNRVIVNELDWNEAIIKVKSIEYKNSKSVWEGVFDADK